MSSPKTADFSVRDFAFLLDRTNRERQLGLSIDQDSIDIREGAVWFKTAFWGDAGQSKFAAPFERTNEAIRLKCIVNPRRDDATLDLNEQGIPHGMKPIAWAADGTGMSLTSAEKAVIPQDFAIKPWPTPKTQPRNVADIMTSRIREWDEGRDALVEALTADATEVEVAPPSAPKMR